MILLLHHNNPYIVQFSQQLKKLGAPHLCLSFSTLIHDVSIRDLGNKKSCWQYGNDRIMLHHFQSCYHELELLLPDFFNSFHKYDRLYVFDSWRAYLACHLNRIACCLNPLHLPFLYNPFHYPETIFKRASQIGLEIFRNTKESLSLKDLITIQIIGKQVLCSDTNLTDNLIKKSATLLRSLGWTMATAFLNAQNHQLIGCQPGIAWKYLPQPTSTIFSALHQALQHDNPSPEKLFINLPSTKCTASRKPFIPAKLRPQLSGS
jgi:hypothetical protein